MSAMTSDMWMQRLQRWFFLACVWLILLFIIAPLLFTGWVAFFSNRIMSFPPEGYSFQWFGQAWATETFRSGFLLSLGLALFSSIIGLIFAVPAALAIARGNFPGRELINTILMSPIMIPAIVAGTSIYLFYIELQIQSGIQLAATFHGLSFAHIMITIPWILRLVTASLAGMDRSVEEASLSLGAGRLRTFFRITLPMIKPGIVAGAMFGFVVSFGDLEKSLLLVGPGRTTLPIAMLNYLEYRLDPTIMAVATIQILLIGAALVISDRYVKLTRTF